MYTEVISPFSTRLRIRNAMYSDGGLYTCRAGGEEFSYTVILQG